jgi:signal peptidase II
LSKADKFRIALTITGIAGGAWLIDATTKHLAVTELPKLACNGFIVIPNFLYFILGTNRGGSNGIPPQFMEFCLAIPAAIMFLAACWLGKQLRRGYKINFLQQLGLGLFLGGALANWSERVLYLGVTDFIYLHWFPFCIFNLADLFIDAGYTTLILGFLLRSETFRSKIRREKTSPIL